MPTDETAFIPVRLRPLALVALAALVTLGLWTSSTHAEPAADDDDSFATGLVFEAEPVYRSFPVMGTYRAFLPPSVDLSAFLPPVGSQGAQSSCVAWATSYGLRGYYENRKRGGAPGAPTFSPSFVYNQIKNHAAGCGVGTSISDALNLMKRIGTVPLSWFPYDPHDCSRLPEPHLAENARTFRIGDWKRVDSTRIDDVKGQLYAGNPVVIGMVVNQDFHRLRGDMVFDDTAADGGGHAMVVVGYDDRRAAFKLFNSWGERWGDRGFGWVDYDTFKARTHAAFVMQLPSDTTAPPPPTPTPIPVQRPAPVFVPSPAAPTVELPRIKTLLADVPCSVLDVERVDGDRVVVRGVVGEAADRDRLLQRLRKEAGVQAVLDVTVMPWPQCEVRGTFAPALAHPDGLAVHIRSSSHGRPRLSAGDSLVLDVTTPSVPTYLYVIYLDAGGEALLLYTPTSNDGRPVAPGTQLTIGDSTDGQSRLAVGAPFGDEMILAVAAPYPLTSTALPDTMTEREFLSVFRMALLGHGSRGVSLTARGHAAAAYTLLTTQP